MKVKITRCAHGLQRGVKEREPGLNNSGFKRSFVEDFIRVDQIDRLDSKC